ISQQPSGSVLVNNFSKKLIKNRIKMLNKMKTKRQILSFYAVLIPVLVLISFGISVKAQSQNEKVKQVIVLSDEKISPEELKVQIKNENGEFEDLDSVKLNLVETSKLPDGSVVEVSFEGDFSEMNQEVLKTKVSDLNRFKNQNPKNIEHINVNKNDGKSTIIIRYKDGKKNDTIIYNSGQLDDERFKNSDEILSNEKLNKKIKEVWLWNSDKSDYLVYKNGKFQGNLSEFNKDSIILLNDLNGKIKNINPQLLSTIDLQGMPEGTLFQVDSISGNGQKLIFQNGVAVKTGENTYYADAIKILEIKNEDNRIISHQSGDKNENKIILNGKEFKSKIYFVENKKVTQKQFEKITKNNNYKISHIISDDAKMIKKYGKEISTSGIVLATKK